MDPSTLALSSALADLCIYNVTDLVALARGGVLHEMILHEADHRNREQRVSEAVDVHSSVAERRATQLAEAEARAADAERKLAEAEASCAAADARGGPIILSLRIHPQLQRGSMRNARTQTSVLNKEQKVNVSTQAPSAEFAAAIAEQHLKEQQQLKQRAHERARVACLPAVERALAAAEAAERVVSQKQLDAHKAREAERVMAEKGARVAAAAAADRVAAAEERTMVAATHSELASLRAAAAATEEERARAEREVAKGRERIAWLERAEDDLRAELGEVRDAYDDSHDDWTSALDRLCVVE